MVISWLAGCSGWIDGGGAGNDPDEPHAPRPFAPPTAAECEGVDRALYVPMRRLTRDEAQAALTGIFGAGVPDVRDMMPAPRGGQAFSTFMDDVTVDDAEALLDVAERVAEALAPTLRDCDGAALASCAHGIVSTWVTRAFRRPAEDADVDRLVGVITGAAADGLPANEALAVGVMALLSEPRFLYVVESRPGREAWTLDDHERAQRLALTLWQSLPDEVMTQAAQRGAVDSGVVEYVARDERVRGTFQRFVREWLGAAGTPVHSPAIHAALEEELRRLIDDAFDADDALAVLLGAEHGYVDSVLEAFYDLPAAQRASTGPGDFHRVELAGRRRGLLTHPLVLAPASHDEESSPILRGKLVRSQLLCTSIPLPPAGAIEQEPNLPADATHRERYEARIAIGPCASCHVLLDPIGFGFEAFDGLGRFRGASADEVRGEVIAGDDATGAFEDLDELVDSLIGSEVVGHCFTRRWTEYALGRSGTPETACSESDLYSSFSEAGRSIPALLEAFAAHPVVVERRAEEVSR